MGSMDDGNERRVRRRRGYNLLNQVMRQMDMLPPEAVEEIGKIPEHLKCAIEVNFMYPGSEVGDEKIELLIIRPGLDPYEHLRPTEPDDEATTGEEAGNEAGNEDPNTP